MLPLPFFIFKLSNFIVHYGVCSDSPPLPGLIWAELRRAFGIPSAARRAETKRFGVPVAPPGAALSPECCGAFLFSVDFKRFQQQSSRSRGRPRGAVGPHRCAPPAVPPFPTLYIKGIVLIFQSRVLSVAPGGTGRRCAGRAGGGRLPLPFVSLRAGRGGAGPGGLRASGSGGAERWGSFRFRRHGAEHALVPLPPPRHRSVRREPLRGGARGGGGGRARRESRGGGAAEAVSFRGVRPGPRCRPGPRERYRDGSAACGCPAPPSAPPPVPSRPAPPPPGGRSFGSRVPAAKRPPPPPLPGCRRYSLTRAVEAKRCARSTRPCGAPPPRRAARP